MFRCRAIAAMLVQWRTHGDAAGTEEYSSVLEYSRVLHNVCMTSKPTRCVTGNFTNLEKRR